MDFTITDKRKNRNASGLDILDQVIGDQGIKTDVSVKIAPATYPLIGLVVMVAIVGGILIATGIQKAIKK